MAELCEHGWDGDYPTPCRELATVSVGADGQWHLCDDHAVAPKYRRFTSRRPIAGAGR